ncbi:MAG: hypothetical protein AAF353_04170 [Pseudomonadota bacterium]
MYLLVTEQAEITLEDSDNLRAFSIKETQPECAAKFLGDIAQATQDNHFWLDAEAVIALSGRQEEPEWVQQFWGMLESVEAYGYSDMVRKRVKAHVESA